MAKRKTISKIMEEAVQEIPASACKKYYGKLHNIVISSVEKNLIKTILKNTDYNIFHAAKWLGVARNTLRTRIMENKIKIKKIKKKKKRK